MRIRRGDDSSERRQPPPAAPAPDRWTPPEGALEALGGRSAEELSWIADRLGGVLHRRFVGMSAAGFDGIVLSSPASPGLGDAFAGHDGSSGYLRGAVTPIGRAATGEFTAGEFVAPGSGERFERALLDGVRRFLGAHQLPGELVIAVTDADGAAGAPGAHVRVAFHDGERVEWVVVAVGGPEDPRSDGGHADELRRRHVAVAALLGIGRCLDARDGGHTTDELVGCVFASGLASHQPEAFERVGEVVARNRRAWATIAPLLPTATRLSVGESFTLGRLARLCRLDTDASTIALLYGWYDPRFKIAVGVPAERTAAEHIAEPLTVELGGRGLLHAVPGGATLAVATSGWANNTTQADRDGVLRDFFSVAVVGLEPSGDGSVTGETIRCSVVGTASEPISPGRRQLTRELGVTAALALLARRCGAERDARELTELLRRWADIEVSLVV